MVASTAPSAGVSHVSPLVGTTSLNIGAGTNTSLAQSSARQDSTSASARSSGLSLRAGTNRTLNALKKTARAAFRSAGCGNPTPPSTSFRVLNTSTTASSSPPQRSGSTSSRLSARSHPSAAVTASDSRSGTPTICITHPTVNGRNLRLSVHQVPRSPSPPIAQADAGDAVAVRKNTRFEHPVVSAVVSASSLTPLPSPAASISSETSLDADSPADGAANGKSVKLSDFRSVNDARASLDGTNGRATPRAVSVDSTEISTELPWITRSQSLSVGLLTDAERASIAQQVQAQPVANSTSQPAANHPAVLLPGPQTQGLRTQTLRAPRTTAARPHTTGDISGASDLPYLAYTSSFDPYNSSEASSSAVSQGQKAAEAVSQSNAALNARHSALYANVEGGDLAPLTVNITTTLSVPAPSAPAPQIRRKAVPSAAARPVSYAAAPAVAVENMVGNGFPVLNAAAVKTFVAVPVYTARTINSVEAKYKEEQAAKAEKKKQKAEKEAKKEAKAADARRAAGVEAGLSKLLL